MKKQASKQQQIRYASGDLFNLLYETSALPRVISYGLEADEAEVLENVAEEKLHQALHIADFLASATAPVTKKSKKPKKPVAVKEAA